MKWICTVCKYVHDGDAPPDSCPVCNVSKEKFEQRREEKPPGPGADPDGPGEAAAASGRSWYCTVCNYVHEGDGPPNSCPVCKKPWSAFIPNVTGPNGPKIPPRPKPSPQNSQEEGDGPPSRAGERAWYCTVCGYVHHGSGPPDICSVCKKPWSAFIPDVEGPDGPKLQKRQAATPAAAETKAQTAPVDRWRCVICNYIHEGATPSNICPICGAGKENFIPEIVSPEHHHRGFAGLIEKLHLHPVSAHFPNGAFPLALLAWTLYLLFGIACLERTSLYLMLISCAAVPFTAVSGWSDAKHRFGTTTTGVFPEKKLWSWLLAVLSLGMIAWRLSLGWGHIPQGAEAVALTILLAGATALAARLGMLGGKLVFGH